ncbi:MAG TPA: hypothetical protein VFB89_07040 [Gemmatimonadales bacterium]|nr:hypothetical protein [Gemmatimonadales bacterium]
MGSARAQGSVFPRRQRGRLAEAVDHYAQLFDLSLTKQQKADLVEYLKTL